MMLEKGIYNLYKPKGPTSYDIIRKVKKQTNEKRIGHAGTLDPLASGVLIVAIGREYTKKLTELTKDDKEYLADIKLGQSSTTQDEEGEKTDYEFKQTPTKDEILEVLQAFRGRITQTPPVFSALKVKGQPAYKLARQGKKVDLKSRPIQVFEIEVIEYKWPILKLRIVCSSGTYIRTLANDIGEALKTGGYLKDLIRTRVGNFTLENTIKL